MVVVVVVVVGWVGTMRGGGDERREGAMGVWVWVWAGLSEAYLLTLHVAGSIAGAHTQASTHTSPQPTYSNRKARKENSRVAFTLPGPQTHSPKEGKETQQSTAHAIPPINEQGKERAGNQPTAHASPNLVKKGKETQQPTAHACPPINEKQ